MLGCWWEGACVVLTDLCDGLGGSWVCAADTRTAYVWEGVFFVVDDFADMRIRLTMLSTLRTAADHTSSLMLLDLFLGLSTVSKCLLKLSLRMNLFPGVPQPTFGQVNICSGPNLSTWIVCVCRSRSFHRPNAALHISQW